MDLEQYPQSPYGRARQLVEELDRGELAQDAFEQRLDEFTQQLERWYAQIESIGVDEDYPEGQDLLAEAKESLQVVYDGTELLRQSARETDPDLSAQGLQLIEQASRAIAALVQWTGDNVRRLEEDL